MTTKRIVHAVIGATAVALLLGAAIAILNIGGTSQSPTIQSADSERLAPLTSVEPPVDYPDDLVQSSAVIAVQQFGTSDPVVFQDDDDGPRYFSSLSDLELQITAQRARAKESPYREIDLMAPARNAKGELVGYLVANVGLVPLAEATDPGFELCKVELKAHNKGVELLNELKASGDEAVADIPIPRVPPYLANCGES